MDTPADSATPLSEVYQAFFDDLANEGAKPSTIHRYRYNIVRFEKWLVDSRHPATLASLERPTLIAYRQYLETLSQQPRGAICSLGASVIGRKTSVTAMVWLLYSSCIRADDAAQLTIPTIDFEMGELFINVCTDVVGRDRADERLAVLVVLAVLELSTNILFLVPGAWIRPTTCVWINHIIAPRRLDPRRRPGSRHP